MNNERFTRQIPLFGEEGQRMIATQKVAIVGLGGIGSHVAQVLAYSGVSNLYFIDDDHIEKTNLNRVVGAGPSDVDRLKVEVARDHVMKILPEASVVPLAINLRTMEAFDILQKCSVIFGCIDHDGPRLVLTELAAAYRIPLIDVASEIFPEKPDRPFDFGGRVVIAMPGEYCLFCANQIDRELAKADLESPEIRQLRRKHGYGLGEDTPAPSVCSLNGIVANLAVMEFLVMVTKIRPQARCLTYKGMRSIVTTNTDPEAVDCYTCKYLCGQGDKVNLSQYLLSN